MSREKRRRVWAEYGWGYLFIAPLCLGLLLFLVYPFVSAIVYSFSEYDLFHTPVFVGFANYVRVFHDDVFWRGFLNIIYFSLGVPLTIFVSLVLAVLCSQDIKGGAFFRALYFVPIVCGSIAVTFIWKWMYAPYYGLIHTLFTNLGLIAPFWLSSKLFIPSMIVISMWSGLGINILLYTAGLKNIPKDVYEAAKIDGAGWWRTFGVITFPSISPITFYLLVTGLIGSMQEFTRFRVMSSGNFSTATTVPVWYIYSYTGEYGYEFGYASALGLIFGLVLLVITAANFVAQRWWVKND